MKITGGWKNDKPTHWRNHFAQCPTVKLNGAFVDHVNEADDVAGYVVVTCYSSKNKILLDDTGQKIKTERREGRVEIVGKRIQ